MEEIKLKVKYNDNSAYVTFEDRDYDIFLNKRDYKYFTIKEIICEPIDTYVIIETKCDFISIYYSEWKKFKEQEHILNSIKDLVNKYDIDYLTETCENNFVEFLKTLSNIIKEEQKELSELENTKCEGANIKLIDLFNKIVNGEELPNKIKIRNDILVRNKEYHLPYLQDYYYMENEECTTWRIWYYDLNDEVEMIGEED